MSTTRDRFNKVMHWQKADRIPNMDFGYWGETIIAWHKQGLPESVKTDVDLERYLKLEGAEIIPDVPVISGLYPSFEHKVLEDKTDHQIIRDTEGNICEVSKSSVSIPKYIKYGLETRRDWERYKKERLDYTRADRIGNVRAVIDNAHKAGMPVRIYAGSLYGRLRNWMGMENLAIAIMTDKEWVEEMMEHLTEMTLYLIENSLKDVNKTGASLQSPALDAGNGVDMAWWWEDMCYNRGPLISPKLFGELMVPRYKRITDALKKNNIDVNILDCDGRIYELVPGWLEAGINCMFPIEAAHTDPIKLRAEYGDNVLLFGGVNKIALINGKDAIDRELERLHPLAQRGGYIPCVDHRVPPDVTFENYLYYLEKKKEIL